VVTLEVTATARAWRRNRELAASAHLGLHPQLVAELPLLECLLEQTRYVEEVGLDAGPQCYRD